MSNVLTKLYSYVIICNMKTIFYILTRTELHEALMQKLYDYGIPGATSIQSEGMAKVLYDHGESAIMTSLRALLSNSPNENITIFAVIKAEQISDFKRAVNDVVGDIAKAENGFMFAMDCEIIR